MSLEKNVHSVRRDLSHPCRDGVLARRPFPSRSEDALGGLDLHDT